MADAPAALAADFLPPHSAPPDSSPPDSLVNVLDRLLETGVVLDGQLVLTVAGVDLVFVGLRALLASTDTARRMTLAAPVVPAR